MDIQIENVLLILSVLFFFSILAGKASSKYGVPALLLFLAVGMIGGSDGFGIHFENIQVAETIGSIALCIILFSGGMDTSIVEVRPVLAQGVILATLGVVLTAIITGVLTWWVLGMTLPSAGVGILTSLLLASTMASTDSASVFSILRSKDLNLKNNLRPLLELESGSNDPTAYVLVATLVGVINKEIEPNFWIAAGQLVLQLVIGTVSGLLLGKLSVRIINKIKLDNDALYPILIFTFCIFIFASTYYLHGNGYLAVYIGGLVIGNHKFTNKRMSLRFFDGIAWMFQLIMFLTLGLLVNPHELLDIIVPALIISFLMIFFVRPLAVFLCLIPFPKMPLADKAFVSWVGLRGAVPIIFAIFTLAADVPHARLIFNIVFFCTLVSLVVQGTSLPLVAKWLKLSEVSRPLKKLKNFDVDFSNDIKSVITEIDVTPSLLENGNQLMDLSFPDSTLVVMVKRDDLYFVPTGKTLLEDNDKILIITDNHEALVELYNSLGIEDI